MSITALAPSAAPAAPAFGGVVDSVLGDQRGDRHTQTLRQSTDRKSLSTNTFWHEFP